VTAQRGGVSVTRGADTDSCLVVSRNEEGEDQLRLRRLQLPFNFTTGEALLYDITPTIDAPDPCSAPKQRKLDDHTVSRESMMGCMLSQNQSLYCDHNKNNAFNTIHDAAFKHSHATLSVPGDAWELAAGGAERSEATVQDMMETLQQILGDDDLGALDIEPEELKSWESTLLKMSSNICESNDHLDDILTYVEEQLQREGGLQNQQPGPAPGHIKLTHMDLPPLGFNGPTLGLQLGATGAPVTFNPSAQNHLRTVQVSAFSQSDSPRPSGSANAEPPSGEGARRTGRPPGPERRPAANPRVQPAGEPVELRPGRGLRGGVRPEPGSRFLLGELRPEDTEPRRSQSGVAPGAAAGTPPGVGLSEEPSARGQRRSDVPDARDLRCAASCPAGRGAAEQLHVQERGAERTAPRRQPGAPHALLPVPGSPRGGGRPGSQ